MPGGGDAPAPQAIALVYTPKEIGCSAGSENFAHYVACCLAATGAAHMVHLVPHYGGDAAAATAATAPRKEHLEVLHQTGQRIKATEARLTRGSPMSVVKTCAMVMVCVESSAMAACGERLRTSLVKSKDCILFAAGLGPTDARSLSGAMPDNIVLGACPCFDVVRISVQGVALYAATCDGYLVVERLSKEKERAGALAFIDMLEQRAGLSIWSHRNISAVAWGRILHSTFAAPNALHGVTAHAQLADASHRRLWAALLHEGNAVMTKAGKTVGNGEWRADLVGVSVLNAPRTEMVLQMPGPMFALAAWCNAGLGISPLKDAPTLMQQDLRDGRTTAVEHTLGEIVLEGKRLKVKTKVTELLLQAVQAAAAKGKGVPGISGKVLYEQAGSPTTSNQALYSAVFAAIAIFVCIGAVGVGMYLLD